MTHEEISDALFKEFSGRPVLGVHYEGRRLLIDFGSEPNHMAALSVGIVDGELHCVALGGHVPEATIERGRKLAKEHGW